CNKYPVDLDLAQFSLENNNLTQSNADDEIASCCNLCLYCSIQLNDILSINITTMCGIKTIRKYLSGNRKKKSEYAAYYSKNNLSNTTTRALARRLSSTALG